MNKKATDFIVHNMVVILFVILCVLATFFSKQPLTFVVSELFTRIARNSFIVLSLIIPVIAGMGLNFGIVIGAMAAQLAIFLTTYWGFTGISGFLLTAALATPFAVFFGFLVGKLFNYMKGNEMIGGLVLGYFADGIYQLVFLFIFGGVIKMNNPTLMIPTGIGVKNTIDLKDTVKYALDTVPMLTIVEIGFYVVLIVLAGSAAFKIAKKQAVDWKAVIAKAAAAAVIYALTFIGPVEQFLSADRLLLLSAVELWCLATVLWQLYGFVKWKLQTRNGGEEAGPNSFKPVKAAVNVILAALVYGLTYVPFIYNVLLVVRLPVLTYLCIGALCCFNNILLKTRLGQDMRTVGQSRTVANAAGINVDRTRIIAMIFSTVLTAYFSAECGNYLYLRGTYPGGTVCHCSSFGRRRFCAEGYQQAGSFGNCFVPYFVYRIAFGRQGAVR